MIVDGLALAQKIKQDLKIKVQSMNQILTMAIVLVGENRASLSYIEKKRAMASEIGIKTQLVKLPADITQNDLLSVIDSLNQDQEIGGIIVQLPLPENIDSRLILNRVSQIKDIDALSEDALVLSPVVVAVEAILNEYQVDLTDKKIAILGKGKLVGQPIALWLESLGFDYAIYDRKTKENELLSVLNQTDVLFLGIGKPHFIKPEMVKSGVVIIDAGTSEESGKLAGDADPLCAEVASVFTPVPGGVGPLTVVSLFSNLVTLAEKDKYR